MLNDFKVNLLVSHAYLRHSKRVLSYTSAIAPECDILIDSGAFTNFEALWRNKKDHKPITLPEYIDACKTFYDRAAWGYIVLDVIRNPDATRHNINAMFNAGLKPLPVLIEGWGADELQWILSFNKRLCVAGGLFSTDEYIHGRYSTVYKLSNGEAKIHGLGYGRYPGIRSVPLASCDSSSFTYGARYGVIHGFDTKKGFVNFSKKDFKPDASPTRRKLAFETMASYGITGDVIGDPKSYSGALSLPSLVSAFSYLRFMAAAWSAGVKYFMALAAAYAVDTIAAVLHAAKPDLSTFDYKDAFEFAETCQNATLSKSTALIADSFRRFNEKVHRLPVMDRRLPQLA